MFKYVIRVFWFFSTKSLTKLIYVTVKVEIDILLIILSKSVNVLNIFN